MGGALSHAAIVARELDYPVLVLPGCFETIADGDLVEVAADGSMELSSSRRATTTMASGADLTHGRR